MATRIRVRSALVVLTAVVLVAAATGCSSDDPASSEGPGTASTTTAAAPAADLDPNEDRGGGIVDLDADLAAASLDVVGGVGSVTISGATPGDRLSLLTEAGVRLVTGPADAEGQFHVGYLPARYTEVETTVTAAASESEDAAAGLSLPPGTYRVYVEDETAPQVSEPVTVLDRDDVPEEAFYDQDLTADCPDLEETRSCFTYITARDGVTLSATIRLPSADAYGPGPYPTLVEYSGYAPSRPDGAGEPGSMIAGLLGYATVGVNMRGSGCSGGVFDTFNPAQQADGYDIIEAVAREDFVLNHRPGMVGLSYSGISQLYAAATRPPSLAAITPLSVIEDPWLMQWPGGIYNQGFTKSWLEARDQQNALGDDSWEAARLEEGDEVCAANIAIRSQSPDFAAFGHALQFRPGDADARRLSLLVPDIEVPVYLTGAWQDEQTGSAFANMLDRFDSAPLTRFTLFNGHHPDGYSPLVISRWYEFLELYVAQRTPEMPALIREASVSVLEESFGIPVGFAEGRFEGMAYEDALAAYESEDPVRVLFENGWGLPEYPGGAQATFEATFSAWPPPEAEVATWALGDGTLLADPPAEAGAVRYRHDPESGATTYTDAGSGDFQFPDVPFEWPAPGPGDAAVFVSEPLEAPTVLAGSGHATLWVNPEVEDLAVEVTLSEVRADGTEYRIQGGWLRLGHRALLPDLSDELQVEPTYASEDFEPLVPGEWVEVTVPVYPFAHPMRAGSRLALRIDTPGRDTPFWAFENPEPEGEVWTTIGFGGDHPSALTLLALPTVEIPQAVIDAPPPCPALRGQVCRDWVDYENTPVE